MGEVRLSRHKGFTFGGVEVNNTNGVFLTGVSKPSTPTLSRTDIVSPGMDGSRSYKNRYEDREISITISIYKEKIKDRREIQRTIIRGLLLKEDRLYFHDEPTLFYIGEVFDEITVAESDFFTELTVKFKCEPFIYGLSNVLPWTGIRVPIDKPITNSGNFDATPNFKIEGTATRINIAIGGYAFAISDVSGTIYVDVQNMTVYTIVNGKKVSVLTRFTGLFPKIPIGDSVVKISGENLNVNVTMDYMNTYIC